MKRLLASSVALVVSVAVVIAVLVVVHGNGSPKAGPTPVVAARASTDPTPYASLTSAQIDALPEARYDAVIPGLMAYQSSSVPTAAIAAYSLRADTALYGNDRTTPVARLDAKNFMGVNTVVVPVRTAGAWTLVMTPARQTLPSTSGGVAAAQTAGWIRTSAMVLTGELKQHIVVSVSNQSLTVVGADGSVVHTFRAGVGTATTPTPVGVIGYLQARYTDPAQGEALYPIQLTSLHSSAADNPYGGTDGGLIGIHYNIVASGAVSHGCIRLSVAAISAVNALPLGTVVVIAR
jgi:lipoprotein-anchoring transpeptidase ErfK/SrfK